MESQLLLVVAYVSVSRVLTRLLAQNLAVRILGASRGLSVCLQFTVSTSGQNRCMTTSTKQSANVSSFSLLPASLKSSDQSLAFATICFMTERRLK